MSTLADKSYTSAMSDSLEPNQPIPLPSESSGIPSAVPAAQPVMPLELTYAPQAKSQSRPVWVLAIGLCTTVVALAGVYALDIKGDTNVMGWYLNYFIPVGALLVGLVASS